MKREKLEKYLGRDVSTNGIAVRFGMVEENKEPIRFYFERVDEDGIDKGRTRGDSIQGGGSRGTSGM